MIMFELFIGTEIEYSGLELREGVSINLIHTAVWYWLVTKTATTPIA